MSSPMSLTLLLAITVSDVDLRITINVISIDDISISNLINVYQC